VGSGPGSFDQLETGDVVCTCGLLILFYWGGVLSSDWLDKIEHRRTT
jgi:hypothetical protein